mgnify:CR=1 FL=1
MRINFDRLSQLAGLPANGNKRGLYEGKMDSAEAEESYTYEGSALSGLDEEDDEEISEPEVKKEMMKLMKQC